MLGEQIQGLKSFVAEAFEAAHCASTPTGGGIFRPPLFDVRDALRAPVVLPAFFYKSSGESGVDLEFVAGMRVVVIRVFACFHLRR